MCEEYTETPDPLTIARIMATENASMHECSLAAQCIRQLYDEKVAIRKKIEGIVCTRGCDAGVILLSNEGKMRTQIINGRSVQFYEHEYFSPLGDALIELYGLAGGTVEE